MKIDLEIEEIHCLMNSLNLARYFYEKLNQIDRAREAQQLHDLLSSANEIYANVDIQHMTEFGKKEYQELLNKRQARLNGQGQVIELYRPSSVDLDDPNEVSANQDIGRIAHEYAKEKEVRKEGE